jgi:hypothetical protein
VSCGALNKLSMKKSSINFKAVTSGSEDHNQRLVIPDYVIPGDEKIPKNITQVKEPIAQRLEKIKSLYCEKIKQKWQNQMTPIKEAVIVLDKACFRDSEGKYSSQGIVDKLKDLDKALYDRYGIQSFQRYIHFDEGKKSEHGAITPLWERNLHAHVLYDWQNKKTGKMAKIGRKEMSEIQTLTAEVLGLERGVVNSKAERLEHKEYRNKMEELQEELQRKKSRLTLLISNVESLKMKLGNYK